MSALLARSAALNAAAAARRLPASTCGRAAAALPRGGAIIKAVYRLYMGSPPPHWASHRLGKNRPRTLGLKWAFLAKICDRHA